MTINNLKSMLFLNTNRHISMCPKLNSAGLEGKCLREKCSEVTQWLCKRNGGVCFCLGQCGGGCHKLQADSGFLKDE